MNDFFNVTVSLVLGKLERDVIYLAYRENSLQVSSAHRNSANWPMDRQSDFGSLLHPSGSGHDLFIIHNMVHERQPQLCSTFAFSHYFGTVIFFMYSDIQFRDNFKSKPL